MTTKLKLINGAQGAGVEVSEKAFGREFNEALVHQVVTAYMAAGRAGTKRQKSKAEVRGGGRKPFNQKGGGRARAGSIRSPIWVGGATIFGPRPRDYSYRLPSSARRSALRSALSLKVRQGQLLVLDAIDIPDGKTKAVEQMLQALGIASALIVTAEPNLMLERAARNLRTVKVLRAEGANVEDILRYQHLVLTPESVTALSGRVTT